LYVFDLVLGHPSVIFSLRFEKDWFGGLVVIPLLFIFYYLLFIIFFRAYAL